MKTNILYRTSRRAVIVTTALVAALCASFPSSAQDYTLSTRTMSWSHDDTSVQSLYISNRDSLAMTISASGCPHFNISPTQGMWRVDIAPSSQNAGANDIVQYLYLYIDDWGTLVTETVTLTHLMAPIPSGDGSEPVSDPAISGLTESNYVLTMTYTSPDTSLYCRDVAYYDGLGYPVQMLQLGGSPGGGTVAVQTVYDAMHRGDATAYLPYVRSGADAMQLTQTASLSAQGAWYAGGANGYSDSRPFAVKSYEDTPYGRPVYIQKEGDAWNAGGGHGISVAYGFNGDTVGEAGVMRLVWHPGGSGACPTVGCAGDWPDSTLSRTRTTDEEGAVSDTYTTAGGLTVCTRMWSGANGTGTMAETYYVYDLRDSLALVVQPEGAAALRALPAAGRTITLGDDALNANNGIYREYCFSYIYDGWGNLVSEHVPGGGSTERTYDDRNRPVLETNDLMKPRSIQTVYDGFDRVVLKRVVDASLSQVCLLYSAEYFGYGPLSLVADGFVADAGVVASSDVETNNIMGMLRCETFYPAANADGTAPAGGITRTRHYYYDYRGRIIQIREIDSDGWSARYSTQYDFVGNVLKSKETHTSPLNETHCLQTWNEYDTRGRLTASGRELDGNALRPVYYNYDELGRLSRKEIGDGPDNIGNIAFGYDIHGWTTGIEAVNNWEQVPVFGETLRYASPQKPGTTARYDGNISEITFTSYNGTPSPSSDTYGYAYDGLGRLTDAAHYAGAAATQSLLKTEKNITYDRNGNITGLDRYGAAGLSEMLSFTHAGNRLSSVQAWDGANLPQIGSFAYDAMGNQLTDSRKGLQFSYNFANLPSKVEGMSGSGNAGLTLNYGYLSDGTKTSAVTETAAGSGAEGLKYRGSFVYELKDGAERLSSVGWSEGRTEYDYSADASSPDINDQWHIGDHLGNVRAVVLMDYSGGTVLEQNEYLPFGTRLANPAFEQGSNRYRLGGKEEQRFGGLDLALSDFGARFYDPFTARWTTRDPLAGKYAGYSPYSYCGGNPIRFMDRDGLDWKDKAKGYSIGVITNIVPGTSALRDAVTITDASDYNGALERTDRASMVVGASMVGGGAGMVAAGEYAAATGGAVALSGAGAPAGAVVATGGATLIAAGAATATAGTMLMANAGKNASEGYDRGRTSSKGSVDNGKNEKHGDGGRALSKSERQVKELQDRVNNTHSRHERRRLEQTIKNIKRDADKKAKGEEHSRSNKH